MRKGADVLSKWVGEAERQLRLLFEEAQKAQPSIIFFDEIDGLAPVSGIPQNLHISNLFLNTIPVWVVSPKLLHISNLIPECAYLSPQHRACMPWRSAAPMLCCSSAVQADAEYGLFCCLFDWEKLTHLVKSIVKVIESTSPIYHFVACCKCKKRNSLQWYKATVSFVVMCHSLCTTTIVDCLPFCNKVSIWLQPPLVAQGP